MLIKIHESYRNIVAVCDSELVGKRFEEGNSQIEIGSFFGNDEKTEEEVLAIIKEADRDDATFNIVGEQSCKIALKAGIINEKGIKRIQGIPVALTLL